MRLSLFIISTHNPEDMRKTDEIFRNVFPTYKEMRYFRKYVVHEGDEEWREYRSYKTLGTDEEIERARRLLASSKFPNWSLKHHMKEGRYL